MKELKKEQGKKKKKEKQNIVNRVGSALFK